MLKITVEQEPGNITLILEGSLSGAWVSELEDVWRSAVSSRVGSAVRVDLADVYRIDAAGRYLLLLIDERGGQMIGSGGRVLDDLVESWHLKMDS